MAAARIGKIRLKAGGAEVRILHQEQPNPGGENWRGKLIEHARKIASYSGPKSDLVGYVIVGLYSDGGHASSVRWDRNRTPIPRRLMPSYVAEIVREEMVTIWPDE